MALSPRLDLRQSQSLVMTPQLQQAIKLLALSNLELEGVLADELAKNPLLESAGDAGEADLPRQPSDTAPATDTLFESGMDGANAALDVDYAAETFHHDTGSDAVWDNGSADYATGGADQREASAANDGSAMGDDTAGARGGDGSSLARHDGEGIDFDSFSCADISLRDHLLGQAGASLSGMMHIIAIALIESVDDAGYLDADLNELALRLGVARGAVDDALAAVQTFDPSGVGARNLAECLAIQAREADRYDPCMARLIDNLDLLARGKIAQLRRLCAVDEEDMADMI
ncbi:MAG: RNA polymerase sigma-54 factor, partial [Sphingopyxis sp.]